MDQISIKNKEPNQNLLKNVWLIQKVWAVINAALAENAAKMKPVKCYVNE